MDIEFVEELPEPSARELNRQFAETLRSRPGMWAKWYKPLVRAAQYSYATKVNSGSYGAFSGGFEAVVRSGDLYVRFVGDGGAR